MNESHTHTHTRTQDAAGRSALHMASAFGVTPIANLLLEKGADPDVQVTYP